MAGADARACLSSSRVLRPSIRGLLVASACLVGCADDQVQVEQRPFEGTAWEEPARPLAIPPGGLGLVTDSLGDTVTAIDLATGAVVATRPVGRNPVDVDGPHHLAIDPAAGAVYVALSYPDVGGTGPHAGHGASQALGWVQRLSLADLTITGQVRIETNPGDIVLSADGRRLVVSHFDLARATAAGADVASARASLAVIDPSTMAITGSPAPRFIEVCAAPHGMALSRPDGALAFVACYAEDAMAVVDLASGAVERIAVGPGTLFGTVAYGPYAAVLSPSGDRVAVASLASHDVRFFDVAAREMEETPPIVLRGAPFFPAWSSDESVLWVPVQSPDGLVRVDLETGATSERPLGEDEGCGLPHEVEVLDEGRLAVVCEGDHEAPGAVLFVDATSLETLQRTEVGVFPDALERVLPGSP